MLGRLLGKGTEQREITWQSLWLTDGDAPGKTLSGTAVGQSTAMKLAAVYDAVRLIADPICTMPIGTFVRKVGARVPFYPQPAWIAAPDPDPSVQRSDHYQAILVSLLLNGNYYGRILRSGGEIMAIRPMDPTRVEPVADPRTGMVSFVVDGTQPIAAEDVVHITDLRKPGALKGTSRIDELRETFGIGKALDEYVARYFGGGTLTSGIVEVPGEMTEEQAKALKDQFEKNSKGLRNAHRPNILTGGAKFTRVGDDAEKAQLMAARDFFVLEVSRAFKIPPSKMGVIAEGTRSYASVEQDNIDFATTTLKFYVDKIEEAYSRLLRPRDVFLRLNMESMLRGDIASRFTAYGQGTTAGFMTINDVRKLEDWTPVDGGDEPRVPMANTSLSAATTAEMQAQVDMVTTLVDSGFTPAAACAAVGLPFIDHPGPAEPAAVAAPVADPADASRAAADPVVVHVHNEPHIDARTTTTIDPGAFVANVDARSEVVVPEREVTVTVEAAQASEPVLTRKRIETDDKGRIVGVIEERA